MSEARATTPQRMDGQDWAMLTALSVVWGASFLFYKLLSVDMPPLGTVAGRVLIGGALLLGFCGLRRIAAIPPRRAWPALILLGAGSNALPFLLFAWAEARVSSGTAAILNAMTPICTLVVSAVVLRTERLDTNRIAGVLCGFAGVAALVGPEALIGQSVAGQAACLGATVCYGFGLPLSRRVTGVTPMQMAVGQMLGAALVVVPIAAFALLPWRGPLPQPATWVALLGISVLSTAIAYVLFFRILVRAGPTNLSLVTFLVPVSALFLAVIVLGETVTLRALGGMALIALGLAAIDGRVLRRVRPAVTT